MRRIPLCEPDIKALDIQYVTRAIKNREISSGASWVKNFEKSFAGKFGMKYASAVNSGGSALFLALKAIGIKNGDEVIVPTFTMFATATVITNCGAKPVFVDCVKNNPNIDPKKLGSKITKRTKAILIAHLYGIPCEMKEIMKIADKRRIPVIEDVAEAHGARINGKLCGTFGKASCFSFYASKTMTSGEGGIVMTNDPKINEMVNRLKQYDINPKKPYVHEIVSWNMKMSGMEAALGLAQLERLNELIKKRNKVARNYRKSLNAINGIEFFSVPKTAKISNWLYTILAKNRDGLTKFLSENGIETKRVFVPMHKLKPYLQKGDYKNAEDLSERGISLPSSTLLKEKGQNYVVFKIKEFYGV
ncbi:MAG: DegT/DnrJ/EryC1/StrS family aminotransferase [Patescibacteria group bacterium]